jgi:cell division protein FtsQ
VIERIPVGTVSVDGRATPVSADGTLLHDDNASTSLPTITARVQGAGTRVSGPDARRQIALLAAAPYPLIAKLSQVTSDPSRGLTAQLRNGPAIYFGDDGRLTAKWIAAADVLADPGSADASYIDVTDPARPAAGSGNDPAGATGATTTGATATGTAATTPAATPGGSSSLG